MLKVNEYFGGTVKSIALENAEGVDVMLPGETVWTTYLKGETFVVEKDVKFKVKANGQVAYYCLYI
jgi:hypothetical protein